MAYFYRFSSKDSIEKKYKTCITNMMVVVLFSAINIILLLTNADRYFLFSAFVPYFIVDYAMYLCGLYPIEYYGDVTGIQFYSKSVLVVAIIIAVICVSVYLVCWILAKKQKMGALIFALVAFVIDTVTMLLINGISGNSILDIVFHIWVIASIIASIVYGFKIKKKQSNAECTATETVMPPDVINGYSKVLRRAEEEKHRVFIETTVSDMNIVFRRVKYVNELVINGHVYDEYEAKFEKKHTLTGYYNSHKIEAVYDGQTSVKIFVDSQEVANKARLF